MAQPPAKVPAAAAVPATAAQPAVTAPPVTQAAAPVAAAAPKAPAQPAVPPAQPAVPPTPQQPTVAPAPAAPDTRHPTPGAPAPTSSPSKPTTQPAQQAPAPAPAVPDAPLSPLQATPQATVGQAAPAADPQAPAGMRLAQAVETVYAVIRMSQSSGITRARVQLHPQELGSIEIHLRQTADGLTAKVVADASQAANVLRHAGDELRRALQAQGLNLTHFDVGTSGQQERRSAASQGDGQPARQGGSGSSKSAESPAPADTTTTEETTIRLPNGVLVDVLA